MSLSAADEDIFNLNQRTIRLNFSGFVQQEFINPITIKIQTQTYSIKFPPIKYDVSGNPTPNERSRYHTLSVERYNNDISHVIICKALVSIQSSTALTPPQQISHGLVSWLKKICL